MEPMHLAEAHGLSLAVRWPHRIEDLHLLRELGRGDDEIAALWRDGVVGSEAPDPI